jgi:AcrR family transcriptional regulator
MSDTAERPASPDLPPGGSPQTDIARLVAALFPAMEDVPRVPQQARSRGKRDVLLQAAAKLFAERGYATTTADDIAAAAGVSVGTFYNYFRHKRQIFLMLVLERLESIFGNVRLAQLDFSGGADREVIRGAVATALSDRDDFGLRRVWIELLSLEPDLVPYQGIIRRYTLTRVEERLQEAVAGGRAWPGLDVPAAALNIFTLLDALSLRRDDMLSDDRLIDSATDMIFRFLFPPEASTPPA